MSEAMREVTHVKLYIRCQHPAGYGSETACHNGMQLAPRHLVQERPYHYRGLSLQPRS